MTPGIADFPFLPITREFLFRRGKESCFLFDLVIRKKALATVNTAPERAGFDMGTYPTAKKVTFGLNLTF